MRTEVLLKNCQSKPVDLKRLKQAVKASLRHEGLETDTEVSIVLTDDVYIRELNRDYRKIDRPTDVLSFSQMEGEPVPEGCGSRALGDIIISVETAERQAAEEGHSTADEIDCLVVHGMLHLLGYDHERPEDEAAMREKEREILEQQNV